MKRVSVLDLQAMHHQLDGQIKRLERRGDHITPPEQTRAAELKKERLLTKDRLADLQRGR
jgi:uncharacterized protein YdcH (DUF465 family)